MQIFVDADACPVVGIVGKSYQRAQCSCNVVV